ncbi:MAG: prepilin-type N-terminal cleavage/methylation domain-containing protein [Firmicutes bacterium]|nr:prepilin-type N-terminal cleavage/methylation domain-containing protein [Bacillota bacterium]
MNMKKYITKKSAGLREAVAHWMNHTASEEGFSLLESLVAIVVFAVVITAVGSSLVMAHRINARSEVLMQEQLKVSRAVEGIMASGIDPRLKDDELNYYGPLYSEVELIIKPGKIGEDKAAFYKVVVTSKNEELKDLVSVMTYVRPVEHLPIADVPDANDELYGDGGEQGGEG